MSDRTAKHEAPATTGEKQASEGNRFKPGQSGNPKGRPKGSRNKLGEQFVAALQADFEENGVAVIETVRSERPQDYLKIIASILPQQIEVQTSAVAELSDEQLAELIERLRGGLPAYIADNARARAEDQARH